MTCFQNLIQYNPIQEKFNLNQRALLLSTHSRNSPLKVFFFMEGIFTITSQLDIYIYIALKRITHLDEMENHYFFKKKWRQKKMMKETSMKF